MKRLISDLQRRYDEQYDKAEAIDNQIAEWNSRLLSVRQEKISADNVYQLLLAFDKLYNTFTEVEQRDFMRAFIERIDIYPKKPANGCWIRNIVFNFPMPVKGQEIKSLPLESEATVETVVCLSKGDVKSKKIRVEFSLEDIDTDGFKKGATYNAIRDWIKAKYGYRVTNLNIAQVKQKHGIIERENYNKPKSPDSKQPGCPEEKVKAIEDAMRHFQMI